MTKIRVLNSQEEKKVLTLSDDEFEQLSILRQVKKSATPFQHSQLVPAYVPKYQQLPEVLTEEQIFHLFKTIETSKRYDATTYGTFRRMRDLALVSLQYHCALRPSEVRQLMFTDFRRDRSGKLFLSIRPELNKVRHGRTVGVPVPVTPLLQEYLKKNTSGIYLFPTTYGTPLSADHYRTIFKEVMTEAGL